MANINSITYNLAFEICSGTRWDILDFYNKSKEKEILSLSHYNFFYSYTKQGKHQFHRINTRCLVCNEEPERNHAGVGNLYLLNPAPKNETHRNRQMHFLCRIHILGYTIFDRSVKTKFKSVQLNLF